MGTDHLRCAPTVFGIAGIVLAEDNGGLALIEQRPFNCQGQRRGLLAVTGNNGRLLRQTALALFAGHRVQRLNRACSAGNHTRTDRHVGQPINHNEAARGVVALIGIKRNGLAQGQLTQSDFVQLKRRRVVVLLQRVDVGLVMNLFDGSRGKRRAELDVVKATGFQRAVRHPDNVGGEAVAHFWLILSLDQHIASADIDFIGERQCDRLVDIGFFQVAIKRHNVFDCAGAS